MKTAEIGNVSFSKVVCGTNTFYGHSHFSEARNTEYLSRFADDERIVRIIRRCIELGVNTVESCANERILSILKGLKQQGLASVRFIGSTRIDETSAMKSHREKLSFLIENRADVCVIHAQYIDRLVQRGSSMGEVERMVGRIHAAGLLAGVSTHQVKTVEMCEKLRDGVDVYLFPLNATGFVYPGYDGCETVQERVDLVRGVSKPFILIKVLGAGRIPPAEGLAFVAEKMKPNDLINLAFGTEEEVTESLALVEKFF